MCVSKVKLNPTLNQAPNGSQAQSAGVHEWHAFDAAQGPCLANSRECPVFRAGPRDPSESRVPYLPRVLHGAWCVLRPCRIAPYLCRTPCSAQGPAAMRASQVPRGPRTPTVLRAAARHWLHTLPPKVAGGTFGQRLLQLRSFCESDCLPRIRFGTLGGGGGSFFRAFSAFSLFFMSCHSRAHFFT